jgi:hypothetical protein
MVVWMTTPSAGTGHLLHTHVAISRLVFNTEGRDLVIDGTEAGHDGDLLRRIECRSGWPGWPQHGYARIRVLWSPAALSDEFDAGRSRRTVY